VNESARIVEESRENIGAGVMGRGMFGPIGGGVWGEEQWRGWWGEDPPYHYPVFILTHYPRDPVEMKGGTTFHCVTDGIESALDEATRAAGGKDVMLWGGAQVANQYLGAGLRFKLVVVREPLASARRPIQLCRRSVPEYGGSDCACYGRWRWGNAIHFDTMADFAAMALGQPAFSLNTSLGDQFPLWPTPDLATGSGRSAGAISPQEVANYAHSFLGAPYSPGLTRAGTDCSGLVNIVCKRFNVDPGRDTWEQWKSANGQHLGINPANWPPGTSVYFHIPGGEVGPNPANHAAIYLGDGKIVMETRPGTVCSIQNINDPYWKQTLIGGVSFIPH
jgi:dihydrofolate reductase